MLYVMYVGGDYLPSFRFLWPIFPLWCALAAASVSSFVVRLSGSSRVSAIVSLLFLVLLVGHAGWERLNGHQRVGVQKLLAKAEEGGRKLNSILPKDAWIATSSAGIVPYFADRKTLDMMGLSDAHIARTEMSESPQLVSGHRKGDGSYVLDRAPELILFLRLSVRDTPLARESEWLEIVGRSAYGVSEWQIIEDPRFLLQYRLVSIPLPDSRGWLNVFAREDAFGRELPVGAILAPR